MINQPEILILNVDHNPISRQFTSQILRQVGFAVIEAGSGAQALYWAKSKQPDLILLEVNLPDINGFVVCQQLKADRVTAAIPIAHITDSYLPDAIQTQLLNSEAHAYLTRPIEAPVLVATVKSLWRDCSQQEEIKRRNRELDLLNRVIAASASALDVESILDTVCRELALALDLPQAAATLLNDSKREAVIVAEYRTEGQPSALNSAIPVVDSPFFQYLLSNRTPLVVTNAQTDPQLAPIHSLMRRRGSVSLLMLPLMIKGEVVGSLGLEATCQRQFSAEEVSLVWSVAEQVGGALARARLTHTQQRLSAAIEQAGEIILITDISGSIVYVNPAFEHITGYSKHEALGQKPSLVKSGRQDRSVYEQLWSTVMAGEVWRGRFVNRKKDGTLYTVNATIAPVRDEMGTIIGYVGVEQDVTHELSLEEQLRQSQKMEAVGRLAGGVAHDFNNLLTVIDGYSNLLLDRHHDPADPLHQDIEQIKRAGERASNLTRQLLAFSRKQILRPTVLDLNIVVIDMEKLLRRLLGEDITIHTHLEPTLGRIKADRGQLEQVIMNLAINARDAMPGGGQLSLETANVTLDELYTSHKVEVEPGNYVVLAISDNGIGMSQETVNHIFEPFFTTKEQGKGTGLGLATVHGIIKQSGGHINVYSEVGQGTTFKIYLPPFQEVVPKHERMTGPTALPRGIETILVVEDEARVRELVSRVLRSSGYTVLEANNGGEALRLCAHQNGSIQLLLTDVVMPGMNGRMLADRLKAAQPGLKVIYMSGYTDDAIIQHGVLDAGAIFIQKPFTTDALIRRVRETLDRQPAP
ncbi:MAG: response regulator [Anaerolineae bacterium]